MPPKPPRTKAQARAPRRDPTADRLARIAAARDAPRDEALASLRDGLRAPESYVVGQAAEMIGELQLRELTGDLSETFARIERMGTPVNTCAAVQQIVRALGRLDAEALDVFLAALKVIRIVPMAGDAASGLRAEAVTALGRLGPPETIFDVAATLYDDEGSVRAAAARVLGDLGSREAALALQGKLLARDLDADVLGACVAGLVRFDAARFLQVAVRWLEDDNDAVVEAVALALGEARVVAVTAVIVRAIERRRPGEATATLLLALALMRSDEAMQRLFETLEAAEETLAVQAIRALAIHRHSPGVVARARAIVERRGSKALREVWLQQLGRAEAVG